MIFPLEALRALLLQNAALNAAVGGRVYKVAVAQGAPFPLVLLSPVSGGRSALLNEAGASRHRVSVEVRSATVDGPGGANTLGDSVCQSLEMFAGVVGGTRIDEVRLVGDTIAYEDTAKAVRRIIDFHIYVA